MTKSGLNEYCSIQSSVFPFLHTVSTAALQLKLLCGVAVDESLSWKKQISTLTTKTAKSVGILGNIQPMINTEVTTLLYYSVIYPYIYYCNYEWMSTHPSKLKPIFYLQKRSLRIINCVHKTHPSLPLFIHSGIISVYQVNQLQIALIVYGALHKTLPSYYLDLYSFNHQFHNYSTQRNDKLRPPICRTSQLQFGLIYRGSVIWHALPCDPLNLTPVQFKNVLKQLFSSPQCSPCGLSL